MVSPESEQNVVRFWAKEWPGSGPEGGLVLGHEMAYHRVLESPRNRPRTGTLKTHHNEAGFF